MSRTRAVVALLLVAALVNLPWLHGAWTDHRVTRDGTDVAATVVDARSADGRHQLTFRFPRRIDPEQRVWSAEVDGPAYDAARSSGQVRARVVADDPSAYRVEGGTGDRLVLLLTLLADVVLLLVLLLAWRFAGRPLGQGGADRRTGVRD